MLIDRCRLTLKDTEADSYSNAELLGYMDDAIRFVRRGILAINPAYLTDRLISDVTDSDVTDSDEIAFPAGSKIVSVYVSGRKIPRKNFATLADKSDSSDRVQYYYVLRNKLYLFPKPASSIDYEVYGIAGVPAVTMGSDSGLDADMEPFLIEYVITRTGMGDSFSMSQEMNVMSQIYQQITTLMAIDTQEDESCVKGYW